MTLLNGRPQNNSLDPELLYSEQPSSTSPEEESQIDVLLDAEEPSEPLGLEGENRPIRWHGSSMTQAMSRTQRKRSRLGRWFFNLPVGRKQILAMLICELIPLMGLGVASAWIIEKSLRQQFEQLSKAEVAITDVQYNIKVNQMALGSRGQSDNPELTGALTESLNGQPLTPERVEGVQKILGNEIQARRIEYATLVGQDLRVVANANRDRTGEIFNPNGLVQTAIRQGRQIKANEIVTGSELQKEGVSLPDGLEKGEDALIRYIVTPIFAPWDPEEVLGTLVLGDLVNGKSSIPYEILKPLEEGYSAIYQRQPDGSFSLASALQLSAGEDLNNASTGVALENEALLQKAVEQPGRTFLDRLPINGQNYTVAVQAEPARIYTDYSAARRDVPIYDSEETHAIVVHGTAETQLAQLLRRSWLQKLMVLGISASLIGAWAIIFRRTVLKPLLNLGQATEAFAEGDRNRRAEVYAVDEVGQLAMTFNGMAESIVESETSLAHEARRQQEQAQQERQLKDLTVALRETLERQKIFETAVTGVRQSLEADRAVVYVFDENYAGTVEAESVLPVWTSILDQKITDPCFSQNYVEPYHQGRIHVISNIQTAGLDPCYLEELEPFQIQANLVIPILSNEQLIGLLCIHQCAGPRDWQERDIHFAQQASIQMGYALEQAELLKEQEQARQTAENASEQQRQQNQSLQMQLIELLSDVENVADGDLTVRTNVTEGAIGTVADFFNSIVESLRQLVTQVKDSAIQVNQSVDSSSGEIRQLAQEALRQSEEVSLALNSVEQMTRSIQAVAASASQASSVSQTAADTAVAGGVSMDRTVDNILTLRETIGETAKKVKRLGESSQQISKVVYLINQIAMQTNLLAINAGIEAARAGEQGQGFAVVAEEVGELAARSASATQEIEQIVENIQRETNEVVQAMELGTSQVVEGTHLVEDAKQNLGQIVMVSQEINNLVKSISDATVDQAHTSHSITELMQKLSAIAQRTSSSSTQVSDSLQDTANVTQQLQESVGTFKVA